MRSLPFDYAVRNLGRSRSRLAMSVLGSTLVVTLVLAAAGFVRGMTLSLTTSAEPRNVIVLGAGSEESLERSEIGSGVASEIGASIEGLREDAGQSYISPEVHVQVPLRSRQDEEGGPLALLRGVTPAALLVHSRFQLVEGRMPSPGRDELVVGSRAAAQSGLHDSALSIGSEIWLDERPWKVVGRFVAPGTVMEAEVWAELQSLKQAFRRDTDSCVVLTLDTAEPADIDSFVKMRLDLELAWTTEADYFAGLSRFFGPIRVVAIATSMLIALGGLLGGLNTMYAAFVSRVRELGMLRCLGYRRGAIVASLVQESVLATSAGSLVACLIGFVLLDGLSVRFSMGAFGLVIDAPVVAAGLLAGLTLGLVGALPPSARALSMPIPEALKSA